MQQIKDYIIVHGQGQQLDARLKALLTRLEEYNINLCKEKCLFREAEVKWFGHIYSAVDPEKNSSIKDWKRRTRRMLRVFCGQWPSAGWV